MNNIRWDLQRNWQAYRSAVIITLYDAITMVITTYDMVYLNMKYGI